MGGIDGASWELPPEIRGASAWYGPDMAQCRDWITELAPDEVAEVEAAARAVFARDIDTTAIGRDDFPLPRLAPQFAGILHDVLDGRGFAVIRGLPVGRWTVREAATVAFGIGSHFGNARSQNGKGHLLGHVKDFGLSSTDPAVRIYQTRERQTYHTDSCDVVGLLCLKTAKSGGQSALVSSIMIHNEMRRRRPDLLRLLFRPIATDRRGEVGPGQKPYFEIPVFSWHAGLLSTMYQRQYIESAQRFPDAPRITPALEEALDMFDALANDPALNFTMDLRPGDLQLVHNHTLLHDRTGFEDWPEPEKRRHLLRLWLAPAAARPLPPVFAERFGTITPGDRGGIVLPGAVPYAPIEAA